jgi:hypothetical protein
MTWHTAGRFPRRPLTFPMSRRELFNCLVTGARHGPARHPDGPAFSLATLGTLDDEHLADIVPDVARDCRFDVLDGALWARLPETPPRRLVPATPVAQAAVALMDGTANLRQILDTVTAQLVEDEEPGFAEIRDVFLALVVARVAIPAVRQ